MAIEIAASFITIVAVGVELATHLYKFGFTEVESADRKYLEFGRNIKALAQNLTRVQEAVEKITSPLERRQSTSSLKTLWDTSDFSEIVGDYTKTLKECEELLYKKNFDRRKGFVRAVAWNTRIEPEISQLNNRLYFHILKIHNVICPLELTVVFDLKSLLLELHQDLNQKIDKLLALLGNEEQVSEPSEDAKYIEVPEAIAERFRESTRAYLLGHEKRFPLRKGMDTFTQTFKEAQGTVGIDINLYLKLLKSVWIMKTVKERSDIPKGSLWERYVTKMDKDLQKECSRSMAPFPDTKDVLRLPGYDFHIWQEAVEPISFNSCMEELFTVPIRASENSVTQNIRVLRNFDGTLQIEDVQTIRRGNESITNVTRFNADTRKAFLMPLYAVSDPQIRDWSITLKSDELSANGVIVPFNSDQDAFSFQQLFTGYSVALHKKNIEVRSVISKKMSFSPVFKSEVGKLQIWTSSVKPAVKRESTIASVISDTPQVRSASENYGSASSNSGMSLVSGFWTESKAGSVTMSFTDSGGNILMPEPEPPLLILFLHDEEKETLSFLSVTLNRSMRNKSKTCHCHSTDSGRKAVIESSKMKARRYNFGKVSNSNIAAVGAFQRPSKTSTDKSDKNDALSKKGPGEKIKNLIRLEITFANNLERETFEKEIENVIDVHVRRMEGYNKQQFQIASRHVASASYNVVAG